MGREVVASVESDNDVDECLRALSGRGHAVLLENDRACSNVQDGLVASRLHAHHVTSTLYQIALFG